MNAHKWQNIDMQPTVRNWVGAAIGAVAGLVGSAMQSKGQSSTNATNAQIAREQMEFQERISNTSHQRQVKDLRAAGLNPILSAGGQGANAPTGARAVMQNPNQGMAANLLNTASQVAQIRNLEAQNKQIEANTFKTEQEAATSRAAEILTYENAKKVSIDNELQEPKKGIYEKGYSLADDAVDKVIDFFTPKSESHSAGNASSAPPITKHEMKQIDAAKAKMQKFKPVSKKSSKNPFIRPWGEYPSLTDPDYDQKLKYYRAQQKLKKGKR